MLFGTAMGGGEHALKVRNYPWNDKLYHQLMLPIVECHNINKEAGNIHNNYGKF